MIRFCSCALLVAAALLAAAAPLCAQVDTSKPITVKTVKPKLERFQGEVVQASAISITVRSRENERVVRSFSYSPELREKMQRVLEGGGYQYGDKVDIRYEAGSDVALRIKGKPSKPLLAAPGGSP